MLRPTCSAASLPTDPCNSSPSPASRGWSVEPATPASIPRVWTSSPPPAPASGGCCRCPVTRSSGAEYSSSDAFQRFTRGPRTLLDGPIFRTRTGLTRNRDWIVEGETFQTGEAATAFTDGVGRLRPSGASNVHALSAAVLGSEVVVYARELYRSGSSGPALISMDLARAEVTRHVPVLHQDPFRLAVAGGALLGLGAKSIVRIAPSSLTIVDSAELPAGARLIGHDETRLVVLYRRSKSLLVIDAVPFAGALGAAVGELAAALTAKPEKARKK